MIERKFVKIHIGYEIPPYLNNYGGIEQDFGRKMLYILGKDHEQFNVYGVENFLGNLRKQIRERIGFKKVDTYIKVSTMVESLMYRNKKDMFLLLVRDDKDNSYVAICVRKSFELTGILSKVK